MAYFTFRKNEGVRVEDALWKQLRRAASREHRLHGDVQSVECLPEGRFKIVHARLGTIVRGGTELSAMLTKDERDEAGRRAFFNASQKLERVKKARPDLMTLAEEAVQEYEKDSAERPDLLPPLTPQGRAEALLEVINEAEQAEAKAREEIRAKPRKGFSLRV